MNLYARRRLINYTTLTLAVCAAGIGLFWLVAILWTLVYNGLGALSLAVFTQSTPPPGSAGGLANAIFGSIVMTVVATLIGTPIGILAGTYLAEYGKSRPLAEVIRFINDILLSAPSIVVGLFIYEIIVVQVGHFSAWAGAMALAIIVLPVVVRTTEDMLNLVSPAMREAAAALGAAQWKVITGVAYRAARNGMITGALLAVARISGETAPLLFTALNNQFWTTNMNGPMANLPVVIFQFALSPYEDWQRLAWAGALLITVFILVLSICARVLVAVGTKGASRSSLVQTKIGASPHTSQGSLPPGRIAEAEQVDKISIRDLSFYYADSKALHEITLPIWAGVVTAFIGPSGCGKSTLLRVLNRMYSLYPNQRAEGEVLLDGENISRPSRI